MAAKPKGGLLARLGLAGSGSFDGNAEAALTGAGDAADYTVTESLGAQPKAASLASGPADVEADSNRVVDIGAAPGTSRDLKSQPKGMPTSQPKGALPPAKALPMGLVKATSKADAATSSKATPKLPDAFAALIAEEEIAAQEDATKTAVPSSKGPPSKAGGIPAAALALSKAKAPAGRPDGSELEAGLDPNGPPPKASWPKPTGSEPNGLPAALPTAKSTVSWAKPAGADTNGGPLASAPVPWPKPTGSNAQLVWSKPVGPTPTGPVLGIAKASALAKSEPAGPDPTGSALSIAKASAFAKSEPARPDPNGSAPGISRASSFAKSEQARPDLTGSAPGTAEAFSFAKSVGAAKAASVAVDEARPPDAKRPRILAESEDVPTDALTSPALTAVEAMLNPEDLDRQEEWAQVYASMQATKLDLRAGEYAEAVVALRRQAGALRRKRENVRASQEQLLHAAYGEALQAHLKVWMESTIAGTPKEVIAAAQRTVLELATRAAPAIAPAVTPGAGAREHIPNAGLPPFAKSGFAPQVKFGVGVG